MQPNSNTTPRPVRTGGTKVSSTKNADKNIPRPQSSGVKNYVTAIPKTKIGISSKTTSKQTSKSPYRAQYNSINVGQSAQSTRNDKMTASIDSRTSRDVTSPLKEQERMKVTRGPFSVNCSTTKEPAFVLKSLEQALKDQGIAYKKLRYGFRCQKQEVRWEVELTQYEETDFLYVLRFTRTQGERTSFKQFSASLLAQTNL